ncbi:DUF429 domain-containing protein [Pseudidiomarina sp.]|uniref:DUF429 domain-containing protein n=1 Tax=Pseudidiomarina sp. TaxID=2081707 RepID=UPI003A9852F3
MKRSVFIGVDVSCAVKKRIPIVFAEKREGRLIPLPVKESPFQAPYGHGNKLVIEHDFNVDYAKRVRQYVIDVCNYYEATPQRIGIDSPLRPRAEKLDYRIAERELNQAGIRCYKTPSKIEFDEIINKVRHHLSQGGAVSRIPHAMQLWMLAGFEISRELANVAPIIETFPQANIRRLIPNVPHKSGKGIPQLQLEAIARHTNWPATQAEWAQLKQISAGGTHDQVDAYSAAWVASLSDDEIDILGDIKQEDAIWMPSKTLVGNK